MEYEGEYKDIVISIPINTCGFTIEADVYENSEIQKIKGIYNMQDIAQCEQLFEDTIMGDYPRYHLTEKGKELAEALLKEHYTQ